MSEVLGAARVLALRNKEQFRKQLGEYYAGKRDIVMMDDQAIIMRNRPTEEALRIQSRPFLKKYVNFINENFPNIKDTHPDLYKSLTDKLVI